MRGSCLIALLCIAAVLPPIPGKRKSGEVPRGAGAAALISKARKAVVIPPTPYTNHLKLAGEFPINDRVNGILVTWETTGQKFQTNYFEAQHRTNLYGPWVILGSTNRSPFPFVSTNRTGIFRVRSFVR